MAESNARLSDRAWLERRYRQDGATVAAIAAEAGVNPSTVHRALARHGIALRGASGRRTLAHVSDQTIKAEVRKAATTGDAARALGVDLATLTERLARMGLRPWTGGTEGAEEMAAEYAAGASIAAIAEARGLSVRTVRRRLAAAGVEMRPVGRPMGSGPGTLPARSRGSPEGLADLHSHDLRGWNDDVGLSSVPVRRLCSSGRSALGKRRAVRSQRRMPSVRLRRLRRRWTGALDRRRDRPATSQADRGARRQRVAHPRRAHSCRCRR